MSKVVAVGATSLFACAAVLGSSVMSASAMVRIGEDRGGPDRALPENLRDVSLIGRARRRRWQLPVGLHASAGPGPPRATVCDAACALRFPFRMDAGQ